MARLVPKLIGGLVACLAAFAAVFFVGMRSKWPPVTSAVRRFNRKVTNPRQMATAGTMGAYASVIEHVGRKSGREYRTPIVAMPVGEGFAIALPYGSGADWVRNVLAAGSATLVHEGAVIPVGRAALVTTASVAASLPSKEVRTLRRFRVDQCLVVRTVEAGTPAAAPA